LFRSQRQEGDGQCPGDVLLGGLSGPGQEECGGHDGRTVGEQLDDRCELNVGDAQGDRGRRDDQAHHDATDEGNGHSDSGRLLGGRIPRPPTRLSDTHPVCLRTTETWTCPTIGDRKSTRLNSSHVSISYAVFCLKKKKQSWWDGLSDS